MSESERIQALQQLNYDLNHTMPDDSRERYGKLLKQVDEIIVDTAFMGQDSIEYYNRMDREDPARLKEVDFAMSELVEIASNLSFEFEELGKMVEILSDLGVPSKERL